MKQLIFSIVLILSLIIFTVWAEIKLTTQCDELLFHLAQDDIDNFQADWESFSALASFLTPYDFIRTADSDAHNYLALHNADAETADIDAARQVLQSSIRDIKRIHDLSWELIF